MTATDTDARPGAADDGTEGADEATGADAAAPATEAPAAGTDADAAPIPGEPTADEPEPLEDTADARGEGDEPTGTLLLRGVPEAARARLLALGDFAFVERLEEADQADLAVVSTHMPRGQLTSLLANLRATFSGRMVALTHTGGEGLAVEVMRAGGIGVVAEGNEEAIPAFLSGGPHDTSLVETYERHITASQAREDLGRNRDELTNLPGGSAFLRRLTQLGQAGDLPRIAFLRIRHLEHKGRRLSGPASDLLRRRLAIQFHELASAAKVELFALGQTEFALLSTTLSAEQAEQLGLRLARVTETYAPTGRRTLELAVGHAGPEVTSELSLLRELAQRALNVATQQDGSAVVGADALALGASSSSELEAAMRMLDLIEQHDAYAPGHGGRVAEYAAQLAAKLGFEGLELARIRLAAYLHDIGKVGLPPEAMAHAGADGDELAALYRSHPQRGADYLRASAGDEVAAAVRAHHEHWDGSGFPDGLEGVAIPVAARIIAVANAYDRLLHHNGSRPAADPLGGLADAAGTLLDPGIVHVALQALSPDGAGTD